MRDLWIRCSVAMILSVAVCGGWATAAEPMDTYRRADALFRQGQDAEACGALYASLGRPAPLSDAISASDYDLLERLARDSARYAVDAARRGDRSAALHAATAGMALSRQVLEQPGATCRDVKAGIALWMAAEEGLFRVWSALGDAGMASNVEADRQAMERLAANIILPRCESISQQAVRRDARVESAEARALVRLWEHHLVRVAADNIE